MSESVDPDLSLDPANEGSSSPGAVAGLYSIAALGLYVLAGGGPFAANGRALSEVLAAYWAGGIAGGAVVGYLLPCTIKRAGAVFVGVLAALPFSFFAQMLLDGPVRDWDRANWIAAFGTALLLGGFAGYTWWRLPTRH